MEDKFKMRSYGYGELALLYFPNSTKKSASSQLGNWIRSNINLKNKLIELGFKPGKRILTPKQVETIISNIGEP